MTRQRGNKPGSLGPAFHTWLEWLETVEAGLLGKGPSIRKTKTKYVSMNNSLFRTPTDDEFQKLMWQLMPVDAYNARIVRSSTKYKVDIATLMHMTSKYEAELEYIRESRPLNLPFEWCTLVITGYGKDDILVCIQETVPRDNKDYPDLGVDVGEKFIDCDIAFYRAVGLEMMDGKVDKGVRLSYCPVEMHFNKGELEADTIFLNAVADGVHVTEMGKKVIELVRACVLTWIHSFHLSSMLRQRFPGAPATPGKAFRRKRLRKKTDHPQFEHFIVEVEIDEPDPEQTGVTMYQPRKRLHQVRGFYRHYKSGKVSWVNPHWRGDENLGVVKKDYELTLHEDAQKERILARHPIYEEAEDDVAAEEQMESEFFDRKS